MFTVSMQLGDTVEW